jgi:hypothetical protein
MGPWLHRAVLRRRGIPCVIPGRRDQIARRAFRGSCGGRAPAFSREDYKQRNVVEHTFRLFKQVLGWTAPKLRDPQAADRWTWLIIACHAQLRLARPLAADLRLPWERPARPDG